MARGCWAARPSGASLKVSAAACTPSPPQVCWGMGRSTHGCIPAWVGADGGVEPCRGSGGTQSLLGCAHPASSCPSHRLLALLCSGEPGALRVPPPAGPADPVSKGQPGWHPVAGAAGWGDGDLTPCHPGQVPPAGPEGHHPQRPLRELPRAAAQREQPAGTEPPQRAAQQG